MLRTRNSSIIIFCTTRITPQTLNSCNVPKKLWVSVYFISFFHIIFRKKKMFETVGSIVWLSLSLGPKSIILHRITAFIRLIHKPRKSLFFLSLSQWIEIKALIFFWVIVPVKLEWVPRKLDVNKWIFILRFRAIYLHLILIIEYIYIYIITMIRRVIGCGTIVPIRFYLIDLYSHNKNK